MQAVGGALLLKRFIPCLTRLRLGIVLGAGDVGPLKELHDRRFDSLVFSWAG